MKKQGFSTSFTVAVTACSAVMGVIIPPSILMVVWGGLMTVSIGGLFLAGVISLAFGLVTPPYGLCLLIACAIGDIKLVKALKDVAIILLPMLIILLIVILFPDLIMFLPRMFMSKFL